MGRTTKTISISIPPEMEAQIQELMRLEGRTRSELLREALRRYMDERRLRLLSQEVSRRAREAGITSEDEVNELVHARRRDQQ
jgi:CopG family transcriptional regulator / antitoxin EndoAI